LLSVLLDGDKSYDLVIRAMGQNIISKYSLG